MNIIELHRRYNIFRCLAFYNRKLFREKVFLSEKDYFYALFAVCSYKQFMRNDCHVNISAYNYCKECCYIVICCTLASYKRHTDCPCPHNSDDRHAAGRRETAVYRHG